MTDPVLEIKNARVTYGTAAILSVPTLELQKGEAAVLQGGNGTGKTSLLRAIIGDGPRLVGHSFFMGCPIIDQATRDRVLAGIRLVPQGRTAFDRLTSAQHRRLAQHYVAQSRSVSSVPVLGGVSTGSRGMALSGGESKLMLLDCLLVGAPRLILLDEPFAGLEQSKAESAVSAIREHLNGGCVCLIADHTGYAKKCIDHAKIYSTVPNSSSGALFQLLEVVQ